MLTSVFKTQSPLHDGAVVVQGGQLIAAGCILPLTQDPHLSRTLGTRHRAAIGITEESDCEVIIVSEETGTVSYAHEGHLKRYLTRETLRETLSDAMAEREPEAA